MPVISSYFIIYLLTVVAVFIFVCLFFFVLVIAIEFFDE